MTSEFSLVIPRSEYQVIHSSTGGIFHNHFVTYNGLRAYSVYEGYQIQQPRQIQDSLVALICDEVLHRATLFEVQVHSQGRITHKTRTYLQLTPELRQRTKSIWDRAEFRNVR